MPTLPFLMASRASLMQCGTLDEMQRYLKKRWWADQNCAHMPFFIRCSASIRSAAAWNLARTSTHCNTGLLVRHPRDGPPPTATQASSYITREMALHPLQHRPPRTSPARWPSTHCNTGLLVRHPRDGPPGHCNTDLLERHPRDGPPPTATQASSNVTREMALHPLQHRPPRTSPARWPSTHCNTGLLVRHPRDGPPPTATQASSYVTREMAPHPLQHRPPRTSPVRWPSTHCNTGPVCMKRS